MPTLIEGQVFSIHPYRLPDTVEDLELRRCTFEECQHRGIWGSQMVAGCALRHVTVRGNVTGGLEFLAAALSQADAERAALMAANRAYYADVDWALDITDARFTSVSFVRSDIPARLIRRDPETQVVVTRRTLLQADWQGLLGNTAMTVGIERSWRPDQRTRSSSQAGEAGASPRRWPSSAACVRQAWSRMTEP